MTDEEKRKQLERLVADWPSRPDLKRFLDLITPDEIEIAQLKQIRWATDRIMDAMFPDDIPQQSAPKRGGDCGSAARGHSLRISSRPATMPPGPCPLCGEPASDLVTISVEGGIQIKGCPACKVEAERSLRRARESYTDHHHTCIRCDEPYRCGCGWPGKPEALCEECAR